jgi:hypothetical protein
MIAVRLNFPLVIMLIFAMIPTVIVVVVRVVHSHIVMRCAADAED